MPTPEQQKLIRKYCILPSLIAPSFVMPLITSAVALALIVTDQVFLRNSTNIDVLLAEIILPVIAYMALAIYCFSATLLGVRTKKWDALVHDIAARNHFQPYTIEDIDENTNRLVNRRTLSYEESLHILSGHPYDVAKLARMELPNVKRIRRMVLLIPLLLQILCFVPQLVVSYEAMEVRKSQAGAVLEQLNSAFIPIAEDVYYDDPQEGYSDTGYDFYAHAAGSQNDNRTYLHVTVEEDGLIYDITYNCDMDIRLTKEENMTKAREGFAQLHAALLASGVDLSSSALTEVYDMSDEFWTAFTEGSYYEEISMDNDTYNDALVLYCYHTEPEAEYDEYANSYVSLIIRTKDAH